MTYNPYGASAGGQQTPALDQTPAGPYTPSYPLFQSPYTPQQQQQQQQQYQYQQPLPPQQPQQQQASPAYPPAAHGSYPAPPSSSAPHSSPYLSTPAHPASGAAPATSAAAAQTQAPSQAQQQQPGAATPSGAGTFTDPYAGVTYTNVSPGVRPAVQVSREALAEEAATVAAQIAGSAAAAAAAGGKEHAYQRDALGDGTDDESGAALAKGGASAEAVAERMMRQRRLQREAAAGRQRRRLRVVFTAGATPRYRWRLLALQLITLVGIIPLLSRFALAVLLLGAVLTYAADYLGSHRGAIGGCVGTVVLFTAALVLSNSHAAATSLGPVLLILSLCGVLSMAAVAALLHFQWLHEVTPQTLCLLERLALGATPFFALPSLLATTTALAGSRNAPAAFLAVLCATHHFFYGPLHSSFLALRVPRPPPAQEEEDEAGGAERGSGGAQTAHAPGAAHPTSVQQRQRDAERPAGSGVVHGNGSDDDDDELTETRPQQLNERPEAVLFSLLVLALPPVIYNAFQSNWDDAVLANVFNTLGILFAAVAYFCLFPENSLWFLAPPPSPLSSSSAPNGEALSPEAAAEAEEDRLLQQLEYDPFGLAEGVRTYRNTALATALLLCVHWVAYRLVTSRYAYALSGLPFPGNLYLLLLGMYLTLFVVLHVRMLLEEDAEEARARSAAVAATVSSRGGAAATERRRQRREAELTQLQLQQRQTRAIVKRTPAMLAAMAVTVIFCVLTSCPGVFYLPAVVSVLSLNFFLLDRHNGSPFLTFAVFSALLLLWWMYRTFSFIVMDLKVIGEAHRVSTAVLSGSVLWLYMLGCGTFYFAFATDKAPLLVAMFLHALQVTWVEHILYSQREDDVYPAALVAATTAAGVWTAYRMFRNGILRVPAAALVMAAYLAKLSGFVVELSVAYYSGDLPWPEIEVVGGWWVFVGLFFLAGYFTLEARAGVRARPRVMGRLLAAYVVAAAVAAALTVRTAQRAVYELLTRSYVSTEEVWHTAPGTACVTFALLAAPLLYAQRRRYPDECGLLLRRAVHPAALVGVLLLAVQPTRALLSAGGGDPDPSGVTDAAPMPFLYLSRHASFSGVLLLAVGRVLPARTAPFAARVLLWAVTALMLGFGLTTSALPAPSLAIVAALALSFFFTLLLLEVAHYRQATPTLCWVLYGASVVSVGLSFVAVGRTDLSAYVRGRPASVLQSVHEQMRVHLLASFAAVSIFTAVVLRCRVEGRSLLPGAVRLSDGPAAAAAAPFYPKHTAGNGSGGEEGGGGGSVRDALALVCNYCVGLSFMTLAALNFWCNDNDPAWLALLSLLLLLLVDDGVAFVGLRQRDFRYFPVVATACGLLAVSAVYMGWTSADFFPNRISKAGVALAQVLVVSLSVIDVLLYLWQDSLLPPGAPPAPSPRGRHFASATIGLNLLVFLFSGRRAVVWLAVVGTLAQCWRLFETRYRKQRRAKTGAGPASRLHRYNNSNNNHISGSAAGGSNNTSANAHLPPPRGPAATLAAATAAATASAASRPPASAAAAAAAPTPQYHGTFQHQQQPLQPQYAPQPYYSQSGVPATVAAAAPPPPFPNAATSLR